MGITAIWLGDNAVDMVDVLGHHNFWHKKGVLIILNSTGVVYVPKGEVVELDLQGNALGKIEPEKLHQSIIMSDIKLKKLTRN
jgi:hypothetical protein